MLIQADDAHEMALTIETVLMGLKSQDLSFREMIPCSSGEKWHVIRESTANCQQIATRQYLRQFFVLQNIHVVSDLLVSREIRHIRRLMYVTRNQALTYLAQDMLDCTLQGGLSPWAMGRNFARSCTWSPGISIKLSSASIGQFKQSCFPITLR